jgi:hypothetical protein
MAASTSLTPTERSSRARLAAHARWARTPDRAAATAEQRAAFLDRFEREVDPDGTLAPEVRAMLAANARSAYFGQLALRSAKARRRRDVA